MGLDTTHEAWHGPYSRFNRWRNELARVAGYTIVPAGGGLDHPDIAWDEITLANIQGDWTKGVEPADALVYLIAHSDCDGEIRPEQAAKLAPRLEELLLLLPEGDEDWRPHTRRFIDGLLSAVAEGVAVEFW